MTNITLSIPEETHTRMKQHNDIRWSEIARRAIEQRLQDLEIMDKIAAKSKLTPQDAEEIGKTIKKAITRRLMIQ